MTITTATTQPDAATSAPAARGSFWRRFGALVAAESRILVRNRTALFTAVAMPPLIAFAFSGLSMDRAALGERLFQPHQHQMIAAGFERHGLAGGELIFDAVELLHGGDIDAVDGGDDIALRDALGRGVTAGVDARDVNALRQTVVDAVGGRERLAVDADGGIVSPYNTEGMYRGWVTEDGLIHVATHDHVELAGQA